MKRIALIVFFGFLCGSFACGACPVLSNYADKVYSSEGVNIIEFDVESDEQNQPIFIYADESRVDEFKILNLTEKKNGRYFKHIEFDVTNAFVYKFYLSAPGYHSLLITTDGTYGMEDITGLCESPKCNRTSHACNATGDIIKRVKTISNTEHYGIDYKVRFENGTVKLPYTETPMNISLPASFMFSLSNGTEMKELKDPFVISGIVYDKDANPAPNLIVGFYLHGTEGTFIHIFTKTGDDGKFIIYYQPKGKLIYVVNLIILTNESAQTYWSYNFRTKYASLEVKKSSDLGIFIPAFPLVPTFIAAVVVGTILILILIGKIDLFKYQHKK